MITRCGYALTVVLLLCPASLAANQQLEAGPPDAVSTARIPDAVATVNGAPIYVEDVERMLGSLHSGATQQSTAMPDFDQLMFRLVNDQLLAQEARRIGLQVEEPLASQVSERRIDMASRRLERLEISGKAAPDEAGVHEAFLQLYQRVTFRVITVRDRDEADEIASRLMNGESFAALATERSIDQFSLQEGLVEDLERRKVPKDLADEVFAGKPGELIGPIPTMTGWAVISVEEIRAADPERFEDEEELVRSVLRLQRQEELGSELAARLKDQHRVTIFDSVVDSIALEKVYDGRILPRIEDPSAIVAKVGDRAITAEDYRVALGRGLDGIGNETVAATIKPLILESLVHDELMKVEAVSRGFDKRPEVERAVRAFESEMLVTRYLEDVLGPSVEVSADEVKQYYQDHEVEFQKPPRIRVGRITVNDREQAEQIASLLEQGTDPAWLARRHSIDDRRETGGDLGWLKPGELGFADLDRSLYDAQPGTVLGPKALEESFAIFFVTAREEQGLFAFEEISGNVRQAAISAKFMQKLHETMQALRDQSEIIVYDDVLDSLSISATPQEKEHSDLSTQGH